MPSFSGRAIIRFENETEYEKLKELYGWRVTLMASWSYNGELVDVENFADIERLNNEEEYAHERLMNSNLRGQFVLKTPIVKNRGYILIIHNCLKNFNRTYHG